MNISSFNFHICIFVLIAVFFFFSKWLISMSVHIKLLHLWYNLYFLCYHCYQYFRNKYRLKKVETYFLWKGGGVLNKSWISWLHIWQIYEKFQNNCGNFSCILIELWQKRRMWKKNERLNLSIFYWPNLSTYR